MKRKLLSILALFCLTVGSVWAQSLTYSTDDIGKLIGSDGNVYATASAVPSGVTVSGMIAYYNESEKWGIAIGPTDVFENGAEGSYIPECCPFSSSPSVFIGDLVVFASTSAEIFYDKPSRLILKRALNF